MGYGQDNEGFFRRLLKPPSAPAAPTAAAIPQYAVIELTGTIPEHAGLPQLFKPKSRTVRELTDLIRWAETDPNLAGLLVRINGPGMGWARMQQMHRSLSRFGGTGKPLYALLQSEDTLGYLLATACKRIVMPESSVLFLTGLRADLYYFRDVLDKLGVEFDAVAIGRYKDALEFLTEREMSAETREMLTSLIDDLTSLSVRLVAESRGIPPEKARRLFEGGPYTAAEALELGLIDAVAYPDNYIGSIEREAGHPIEVVWDYSLPKSRKTPMGFFELMRQLMEGPKPTPASTRPYVALVYATGQIVSGRKEDYPFAEQLIAQDDFLELLDEIESDGLARAVVLRVDSPGGSAEASDVIWNRLSLLAEGIPVVVSMGDLAASGGYYISMPADAIFAEHGTLTGSIGVIGAKLVLGRMYEKIGVRSQSLAGGPYSGILSEKERWNDAEREKMTHLLGDTYWRFVRKAALNREMSVEELDAAAQGRVWSGRQARELGLVDELGGLEAAIAAAKDMAAFDPADDVPIVEYPRPLTLFEYLERMFPSGVMATPARGTAGGRRGTDSRGLFSSPGRHDADSLARTGIVLAELLGAPPMRQAYVLSVLMRQSRFLAHAPFELSIR
jgi:protease-4